jgi:hypothetical protein
MNSMGSGCPGVRAELNGVVVVTEHADAALAERNHALDGWKGNRNINLP